MIKVSISDDVIKINGHAGYDIDGHDIVCASVSSIVITTVNALIRLDGQNINYIEKDGVEIKIIKHTDIIDKLIDNLCDLLIKLEKDYPKYIKIRRC